MANGRNTEQYFHLTFQFCNFANSNHILQMRFSIYTMILIVLLSSCAKEDNTIKSNVGTLTYPIASFTYSGNENPAPVTITFTNASEYSDAYEWDFGDGSTPSAEFSPTHKYFNPTDLPKSFLVKLTATDTQSGLSNTRSKSIQILPAN